MRFPAEAVPDGGIFLPHHLYIGVGVMLFGFALVWDPYDKAGAVLTLLGLYIAADDAVSHVFGVWTPLDHIWKVWLAGVMT
ncbi:hypothetical protein ACFR9U_17235 [Halorientalis brevis]|uniref:LexA-binding, inner membrane-associated hydrolase n=1 Tax=Halorientalis brevis TaxID=1126241 RepID=A0ABD6CEW1_9EURY|nr:hypothetical protein [Halorientalis brevis]